MVDQYWRKIESVENNIENAMQISGILLKLKGYDEKLEGLSKIGTNENNISSNLSKINNIKEFLISPENFKKSFNIEKQIFRFNRNSHFYIIFEKEITHNFTKNSLLFIDNNIHYKYENLLNDYYRL